MNSPGRHDAMAGTPADEMRPPVAVPHHGLFDQWPQAAASIRLLAHLSSAVESSRGEPAVVRAAAFALSTVVDLGLVLRVDGRSADRSDLVVDTISAAVWGGLAGAPPIAARTAVVAAVVPRAVEVGFRLGAGTTAVPVVEPARLWRPAWSRRQPDPMSRSSRSWVDGWPRPVPSRMAEILGAVAKEVAPPLVALAAARWARGRRTGFGPLGWTALAAGGGYALARVRDDAQRATTTVWDRRTSSIVEEARVASRVHAGLVHNHTSIDPKAMLAELARGGSARAEAALQALRELPMDTLRRHDAEGTTLVAAVEFRPVEPPEDRSRWVPNDQVQVLRSMIEARDDELVDADDDETVRVLATEGPDLVVSYRGQRLSLVRPTPELVIRLDSTVAVVSLGGVWILLTGVPGLGAVPWPVVAAAGAMQAAALGRLLARPPSERRSDHVVAALVTGAALVVDGAVAARPNRSIPSVTEVPVFPATGATQAAALLVAANWRDLGRARVPMIAASTIGWTLATMRSSPRRIGPLVQELAFVLMPVFATVTVGADARREADALDDHLERRLDLQVEQAARLVAAAELGSFRAMIQLVLDEVAHAGLPSDVLPTLRQRYRRELRRLDATDPLTTINW